MTLPLVKLATIAIGQLSKPLANGIKKAVRNSPIMTNMILYPAQGYHKLERTVRMHLMGMSGKVEVKPLTRQAAVDLGAELAGELVIFSVAVACLYAELKRGQGKDRRKEEAQNSKLASLQDQITELTNESKKLESRVQELTLLTQSIGEKTSRQH